MSHFTDFDLSGPRMRYDLLVGLCCACFFFQPAAQAETYLFSRGADLSELGIPSYDGYSDVRLNASFPDNGAGAESLYVGDSGNGAVNRSLMRWDLSSLTGGTIVGDATLTMRVTQVSQDIDFEIVDGSDFFDFHRIVDSNAGWVEDDNGSVANGPATGDSPSWNNYAAGPPAEPWFNASGGGNFPGLGGPGDGYAATPAFTLNQPSYDTSEPLDVEINVPRAVVEEIISAGDNHPGFLIRARDEFFAGRIAFSGNASLHSLTIEAVDVPPTVAELTVDRSTRSMTLTNNTAAPITFASLAISSAAGSLLSEQWLSIAENYDAGNPGPDQIDSNDDWTVTSLSTDRAVLSEDQFSSTGPQDGATLGVGQSIDLGTAWIQSPVEDLQLELTLADSSTQSGIIRFLGNNDAPFEVGDLNFDGVITDADWPIYRDGFDQDLSSLSQAEAYGMGDLNNDGVNDHADFVVFRNAFDAANGSGAFAAMVGGVPEPASVILLACCAAAVITLRARPAQWTRRATSRFAAIRPVVFVGAAASLVALGGPAHAVLVEIDNNAGVRVISGSTNSRDDNNGGADSLLIGINAGGIDNFSFYGFDLSSVAGMTAAGDATLTVENTVWSHPQHGSTADVINLHEMFLTNAGWVEGTATITGDDNLTDDGSASFLNFAQFNDDPGAPSGSSIPWKDAAGNDVANLLGAVSSPLDDEPGTDNNVGSTLTFTIDQATAQGWIDNGLAGLVLSVTDDGNSMSRFRMGAATLSYDIAVDAPTIEVNTTTGQVNMYNDTDSIFDINFYEIISPGEALNSTGWNSFAEQDLDGNGAPDGTGDGWEELGTPHATKIAEAYLQGSEVLSNGFSEALGFAFNPAVFGTNEDGDLAFNVGLTDGSLLSANVVYITGGGIPGDYNGDGSVDAADYTVWRDTFGAMGADLPADGNGDMVVDSLDYDLWRANFGNMTAGLSADQAAVPEPGALLILGIAATLFTVVYRGRN